MNNIYGWAFDYDSSIFPPLLLCPSSSIFPIPSFYAQPFSATPPFSPLVWMQCPCYIPHVHSSSVGSRTRNMRDASCGSREGDEGEMKAWLFHNHPKKLVFNQCPVVRRWTDQGEMRNRKQPTTTPRAFIHQSTRKRRKDSKGRKEREERGCSIQSRTKFLCICP